MCSQAILTGILSMFVMEKRFFLEVQKKFAELVNIEYCMTLWNLSVSCFWSL